MNKMRVTYINTLEGYSKNFKENLAKLAAFQGIVRSLAQKVTLGIAAVLI